jgi:hypothetical protein
MDTKTLNHSNDPVTDARHQKQIKDLMDVCMRMAAEEANPQDYMNTIQDCAMACGVLHALKKMEARAQADASATQQEPTLSC